MGKTMRKLRWFGIGRSRRVQPAGSRVQRLWRGWVRPLILVLIISGAFRSAVADWNDVPTGSMNPSILEGDRIFVNKLAYDLKVPFTRWRLAQWGGPARGDVVVFASPADGKRLVKRVVGLPGDVLELRDNRLLINGQAVSYAAPPAGAERPEGVLEREQLGGHDHPIIITPSARSRQSFGPVTVPADCYFMMGDNRDVSFDSRYFGFVERRLIAGRAGGVVLSVDPARHYAPRWGRFFTTLP